MFKDAYSRHIICLGLLFAFTGNLFAQTHVETGVSLPTPGTRVHSSPAYNPPILKGIKTHPDNPFKFEFVLDCGDTSVGVGNRHACSQSKEPTKLIKYFLASLTIPEKDLWVNLSPYEKDRIVPDAFGQTEMGRDLLAQDYMLKQITASLIYPEDEIGKKFWKRAYEEAAKKFGSTSIPVNTFNKVWIVPEKAVVYENAKAGTAYVVESKLKVMLEEDYVALSKDNVGTRHAWFVQNDSHAIASQIIREIIIPALTKEINEGKNFAQLRQVYNSLILATWYKKKIKDSILAQVYTDKNKINGIEYVRLPTRGHFSEEVSQSRLASKEVLNMKATQRNDPNDVELIYQRYLQAFKKGAYNYIKEETDPVTQQRVPRKYFSGGILWDTAMVGILPMPDKFSPVGEDSSQFTVNLNPAMDVDVKYFSNIADITKNRDSLVSALEMLRRRSLDGSIEAQNFLEGKISQIVAKRTLNGNNLVDITDKDELFIETIIGSFRQRSLLPILTGSQFPASTREKVMRALAQSGRIDSGYAHVDGKDIQRYLDLISHVFVEFKNIAPKELVENLFGNKITMEELRTKRLELEYLISQGNDRVLIQALFKDEGLLFIYHMFYGSFFQYPEIDHLISFEEFRSLVHDTFEKLQHENIGEDILDLSEGNKISRKARDSRVQHVMLLAKSILIGDEFARKVFIGSFLGKVNERHIALLVSDLLNDKYKENEDVAYVLGMLAVNKPVLIKQLSALSVAALFKAASNGEDDLETKALYEIALKRPDLAPEVIKALDQRALQGSRNAGAIPVSQRWASQSSNVNKVQVTNRWILTLKERVLSGKKGILQLANLALFQPKLASQVVAALEDLLLNKNMLNISKGYEWFLIAGIADTLGGKNHDLIVQVVMALANAAIQGDNKALEAFRGILKSREVINDSVIDRLLNSSHQGGETAAYVLGIIAFDRPEVMQKLEYQTVDVLIKQMSEGGSMFDVEVFEKIVSDPDRLDLLNRAERDFQFRFRINRIIFQNNSLPLSIVYYALNRVICKYGYVIAKVVAQKEIIAEGEHVVNVGLFHQYSPPSEDEIALLEAASYFSNVNLFVINDFDVDRKQGHVNAAPLYMFKDGKFIFNSSPSKIPLHYIINHEDIRSLNVLRWMKTPTADHPKQGNYTKFKDITMMELEKRGIHVPRWQLIVTQKSKILQINRKRELSTNVKELDLKAATVKDELIKIVTNFLTENNLENGIIKPNQGSNGKGVVFFDRTNIDQAARNILSNLKKFKGEFLIQERIEPIYIKSEGGKLDWNVRVFATDEKNGRFAKIARVDKEGGAVNISLSAKPWLLERVTKELGLTVEQYYEMEKTIDEESRKSFQAINKAMEEDGVKPTTQNATDFMGVDIIVRYEKKKFQAYVIELNDSFSGAAWDLNIALREAGPDIISESEASRRRGEASTGWLTTIYKKALDYKNTGASPTMAKNSGDAAMATHGGIDLSSLRANGPIGPGADKALVVQNNGPSIQFHLDPAQMAQWQNAPGVIFDIIDMQPMTNIREFLGLS